MLVTADQQLLKQINRMALVRHLCNEPGLSRAALAESVGLTKSTVSLLVRELMDEGWLGESELVATGELGRRATPLHVDGARRALLGAELGIEEGRIVATNLLGEVLDVQAFSYDDVANAASCIALLGKGLVRMARRMMGDQRRVLGVGIGLHGGVDDSMGVLHYAPHLGWRAVHVGGLLSASFARSPLEALPLFMQNEANVAALAEYEFNGQSGADPLIYLSIGHGVGAGVIVSDRLLTGLRGFAGEVGHAVLQVNGPICSCGRRGCADALIGLSALIGDPGSQGAPHGVGAIEDLFQRVREGDSATMQLVNAAGRNLGVLLNNHWSAFDPACIVVGGAALRLGDAFTAPAREVLAGYAAAAGLDAPEVRAAQFGNDAIAVGGAAMVRHYLTRPFSRQLGFRRDEGSSPPSNAPISAQAYT